MNASNDILATATKTRITLKSCRFMTLVSLLAVVIIFSNPKMNSVSRALQSVEDERITKKKPRIVGFWHLGISNREGQISRDEFAVKQFNEIQNTELFRSENEFDVQINLVTRVNLSSETKSILLEDPRFIEHPPTAIHNMEEDEEYYEFTTLMELYEFCRIPENSDAITFYIHSKTSDGWRINMENYVLGQGCMDCMRNPDKVACGSDYVDGYKWKHFSGNFWMARCDYVAELNPPFSDEILYEANVILSKSRDTASGFAHDIPPFGRFFC